MRLIDRLKLRCKVEPATDCWVWDQGHNGAGYPQISLRPAFSTTVNVRRLVYIMEVGQIPKGRLVTSTCQDPSCINPAHLRFTTRQTVGKKNIKVANAKLTSGYRKVIWQRRRGEKPAGQSFLPQPTDTLAVTADRQQENF